MSFFVLYLLVHGPVIAAGLLELAVTIMVPLGICSVVYFFGLAVAADNNRTTISDMIKQPVHVSLIKWGKRLVYTVIACVLIGKAIPDQKSLALIVGGGITYEVVTSETGKRIGSKAASALERKVDEILNEPAGAALEKKVQEIMDRPAGKEA